MTLHTGIPEIDDAKATPLVGSDEVGFGSWAGELVVCAVATPCDWDPKDPEVRDSKTLSEVQRERVYNRYINDERLVISPSIIPVEDINESSIHACLKFAHREAIAGTFWRLPCTPIVVVDGIVDPQFENLSYPPKVFCLPKADALVPAVALASIIAKVTRDRMMVAWDKKYPGYGFNSHKGYGTAQHQAALKKLGPCPIHRTQYAPIARAMKEMRSPERALFEELCDED